MRSTYPLAFVLLLSVFVSTSCSNASVPPASSTAGALTANSSLNTPVARRFDRHILAASGLHSMSEFIRGDVRGRLDEEPVGDADSGFDPGAMIAPSSDGQQQQGEVSQAETGPADLNGSTDEETAPVGASDSSKFLWAKKSFGEAVKTQPTNNGVIVLYADENLYDLTSLMRFIEQGRDRITMQSGMPGDRIQVVFGGYRAVPQVELWIVPDGAAMPEFEVQDRSKPTEPEN